MWCKVTVLSPLVQFKVDSSSIRHSHCVCGDTVHGVSCLVPCTEQVYPKKCAADRGSLLPLEPCASGFLSLRSVFCFPLWLPSWSASKVTATCTLVPSHGNTPEFFILGGQADSYPAAVLTCWGN